MRAVPYSKFQRNLSNYMKRVNHDSDPLLVTTKQPGNAIVVIGKRDYDAMQETMYLLSSEKLRAEINRGAAQFNSHNDE